MNSRQRRWILALAVLDLVILLALGIGITTQAERLRQTFADWTGEEEPSLQLRALAYLTLSWFQPPRDTADDVPMPYTDVPPFGVNTFFEQEVEEPKIRLSMKLIKDAGFYFIRQEFPWEDIEQPHRGEFWDTKFNKSTWEKYDRIVALAEENGLHIIARLDHPPNWSRHDGAARGNFAPPDNFEDYGDFVKAVVTRYRGKIKYYQLWNEPNIYPEWGEQPVSAADYTRLLKIGYTRLKEADPNVVILSAGLAQTIETGPRNVSELIFLQEMYDAGAKDYFDILAVQDYGLFWGPGDRRLDAQRTNFSRPILVREIMVKNGDAHKPMWAMEIGWNAVPANFEFAPFGRVTDAQQARYAVQAYERAQSEWAWMGVLNYWFFKRAYDNEREQPFYYFRLFDPDFTPRPVFRAIKDYIATARWLGLGFHQETHWAIEFAGNWLTRRWGNGVTDAARVGQVGDTMGFDFRGNELELALVENPYSGVIRVRIDGGVPRTIDLRSTDPSSSARVVIARNLSPGQHHAEITVERGALWLDGVIVKQTNGWWSEKLGWLGGLVVVLVGGVILWRRK